jgi:2-polyprenyl-3-methyl-5-hydroxy-6-metoxy-1,4-benzoquinol methylase
MYINAKYGGYLTKIKGKFAYTYDNFVTRQSLLPKGLHELIVQLNVKTILELGCGTGTVAAGLSLEGYDLTGLDFSGDMLKSAKLKAKNLKTTPKFINADITDFKLNKKFDLILCLGNTFPLISKVPGARKVLQNCVGHLNPGGTAVFQQLNYDSILKSKITTFAIDSSTDILRVKQYKYGKILIDFIVTIIDTNIIPPKLTVSESKIRPWLKSDLIAEFKNAGFSKVSAYGSYNKDKFNLKSKDLVLVAKL